MFPGARELLTKGALESLGSWMAQRKEELGV